MATGLLRVVVGDGEEEVPASVDRQTAIVDPGFVVALHGRIGGVRGRREALAAELVIHLVMNGIEPFAQRVLGLEHGVRDGEFPVVVGQGRTTVLTGENVRQCFEEAAHSGFLGGGIVLKGEEVKEPPPWRPPETGVHTLPFRGIFSADLCGGWSAVWICVG